MDSGNTYSCNMLLHEFEQYLPMDEFVKIRRCTIVRISAINQLVMMKFTL